MQIVVDWDGTATEVDGLHLVLLEFGDAGIFDAAEAKLGQELTLHEVIAFEFESIRAPLEDVVEWVRENVRLRAGFVDFARSRQPLVVSSGGVETSLGSIGCRDENAITRPAASSDGPVLTSHHGEVARAPLTRARTCVSVSKT